MPFNSWPQIHFGFWKLFNDPPGTPKELKCVGCKAASAGLSFLVTGVLGFFGVRRAIPNIYQGLAFGLAATVTGSTAIILSRMAYEDTKYNEMLINTYRKELKELRKAKAQEINNESVTN